MIIYTGNATNVFDLARAAKSLADEGYSSEEIVWELIEYCATNGIHVYKYDIEMMLIRS